jgi:hypothetical protein
VVVLTPWALGWLSLPRSHLRGLALAGREHVDAVKGTEGDWAALGSLRGHTDRVRGLVWNSELPFLLISGSWDCS